MSTVCPFFHSFLHLFNRHFSVTLGWLCVEHQTGTEAMVSNGHVLVFSGEAESSPMTAHLVVSAGGLCRSTDGTSFIKHIP